VDTSAVEGSAAPGRAVTTPVRYGVPPEDPGARWAGHYGDQPAPIRAGRGAYL